MINGCDFERYVRPSLQKNRPGYVYAWLRTDDVLYVGSTYDIAARLMSHHVIGKKEPVLSGDEIRIWRFDSRRGAMDAEYDLIWSCKPKYNSETREFATFTRRPPLQARNYWKAIA